jgi:hypothetical protein
MNAEAIMQARDRPVLNQKIAKNIDNSVDRIGELLKCWNDGFSFQNLPKSYVEGKLKVHIHCRLLPFFGGHAQEYCALFQGDASRWQALQRSRQVGEQPIGVPTSVTGVDPMINGSSGYQEPVLVYDIEAVESPKYIAFPSFVRFEPLDCVNHFETGARYFSSKLGFNVGGDILPDGERGARADCSSADDTQFAGQMIQSGSKVVDRVTNDSRDAVRQLLSDEEVADAVPCPSIIVEMSSIGILLKEGRQFKFEVLDVFFGPVNLYPDGRYAV